MLDNAAAKLRDIARALELEAESRAAEVASLRGLLEEAREAIKIPVSEANPDCNCRMCRVAKPLLARIDAALGTQEGAIQEGAKPEGKGGEDGER